MAGRSGGIAGWTGTGSIVVALVCNGSLAFLPVGKSIHRNQSLVHPHPHLTPEVLNIQAVFENNL
jgi:hypothetical protein